jgi:hypothetical protein
MSFMAYYFSTFIDKAAVIQMKIFLLNYIKTVFYIKFIYYFSL